MDEFIALRCLRIGQYIIENRATVRQAARVFGISKSSVHKDVCDRLPQLDARMSRQAASVLRYNKAVRHLRGGDATRRRYALRRLGATLH